MKNQALELVEELNSEAITDLEYYCPFEMDTSTSSATKCKLCGKEKWQHQKEMKEEQNLDKPLKPQPNIPAVVSNPIELVSVLAEIEHINNLGKSTWYEVVYFDGNWRCYAGSKTFKDGERVIKWKYAKDCL